MLDILLAAGKLYDDSMTGSITIESLLDSQVMQDIERELKTPQDALQSKRTAKYCGCSI